jgi:hypothetical protein
MSSNKRRKIAEDKAEEPEHMTEDNPLISNQTTHTVRLRRAQFIHMRDYIRSKPNHLILCLNYIEQKEKEKKSAIYTNELKEKIQKCARDVEHMQTILSAPHCLGESYRLHDIIQKNISELNESVSRGQYEHDGVRIFEIRDPTQWSSIIFTEGTSLKHNLGVTEEFYEKNKDFRWEHAEMKAIFEFIKNPPDFIDYPLQQIMPPHKTKFMNASLIELEKIIQKAPAGEHQSDISENRNLTIDFIVKYYSKGVWDLNKVAGNFIFNAPDIAELEHRICEKIRAGERIFNTAEEGDDDYISADDEKKMVHDHLQIGFCSNPNLIAKESINVLGSNYDAKSIMKNWFLWDIRAFRRSFNKDIRERCYLICLNTKHIVPETITAVILKYIDHQ